MIVDGKGNMFENRRQNKDDRRQNKVNVKEERRVSDRRKTPSGERNTKNKR